MSKLIIAYAAGVAITATYTLDGRDGVPLAVADDTAVTLILHGRYPIGEYTAADPAGERWHYTLGDAQLSVRQLTAENGAVVLARTYTPFGLLLQQAGSATAVYGYAGAQADESGLWYFREGYFDPASGRFLSANAAHPLAPLTAAAMANPGGSSAPPTTTAVAPPTPPARSGETATITAVPCPEATPVLTPGAPSTPTPAPTSTSTPTVPPIPTPNPTLPANIEWQPDTFKITHYTFALERDPRYINDEKVSVPGLPDNKRYRRGFIFGARGIIQQGTGLAEDGQYITIDWSRSTYDPNDVSNSQ